MSSPDVLTDDGVLNYAKAIGLCVSPLRELLQRSHTNRCSSRLAHSSQECLGLHLGAPQTANLGDGNGSRNQTVEFRQDFGNAIFGSCFESLLGGNHFR